MPKTEQSTAEHTIIAAILDVLPLPEQTCFACRTDDVILSVLIGVCSTVLPKTSPICARPTMLVRHDSQSARGPIVQTHREGPASRSHENREPVFVGVASEYVVRSGLSYTLRAGPTGNDLVVPLAFKAEIPCVPAEGFVGISHPGQEARPQESRPRFSSRPYHLIAILSNFCLIFLGRRGRSCSFAWQTRSFLGWVWLCGRIWRGVLVPC